MDTLDDPYEGDLIRLVKVNEQIDRIRRLGQDDPGKWEDLLLAVGALRDTLEHVVLDIKHRTPGRNG